MFILTHQYLFLFLNFLFCLFVAWSVRKGVSARKNLTLATKEYKSFAKCVLHYCFINVSTIDDLNQREVLNGVFLNVAFFSLFPEIKVTLLTAQSFGLSPFFSATIKEQP